MYFEVFKGIHDKWYWRLVSKDKQKIAFSGRGYATKQDILASIEQFKKIVHDISIRELQSQFIDITDEESYPIVCKESFPFSVQP